MEFMYISMRLRLDGGSQWLPEPHDRGAEPVPPMQLYLHDDHVSVRLGELLAGQLGVVLHVALRSTVQPLTGQAETLVRVRARDGTGGVTQETGITGCDQSQQAHILLLKMKDNTRPL